MDLCKCLHVYYSFILRIFIVVDIIAFLQLYYLKAYANNQHKIKDVMLTNPFLKAMEICKGTVSILDTECVVYGVYSSYTSQRWMIVGASMNLIFIQR